MKEKNNITKLNKYTPKKLEKFLADTSLVDTFLSV